MNELKPFESIEDIKQQMSLVQSQLQTVVFNEDNEQEFKKEISTYNKLNNAVDTYRKEFEKQHKALIEDDVQILKDFFKETKSIIDDVQNEYREYLEEQREQRLIKIKRLYEEIVVDYSCQVPFMYIEKDWYGNKSTTQKSIKEDIINELTNHSNIFDTIDNKALYIEARYDLQEYNRLKSILEHIEVPQVKQEPTNDGTVTIKLNKNYLQKLDELKIKYEKVGI